ncbi:mate-domain-containing protein [Phascolomyces articulosus]|uniref:Mate-domain-containing protein n=1 Tax=Phascolomyces articulosus TaxID=60185 RepID=A0AAD5PD57_9FUNG|nr:mate-domain-containing protein [Phascolomyces articulosus]
MAPLLIWQGETGPKHKLHDPKDINNTLGKKIRIIKLRNYLVGVNNLEKTCIDLLLLGVTNESLKSQLSNKNYQNPIPSLLHSSILSDTPTESTLLLPEQHLHQRKKYNKNKNGSWSGKIQWLFFKSLPVIGTYLLQYSLQLASIFTLGHLGQIELAGAALAAMFASVSAWSLTFGTTTALDTLCSQAWTAARDKTLVGIHLQRALIILAIIYIGFIIPFWWNRTYLRYLLLGAPPFIAFEGLKKYLQAQGIMRASTYVLLFASPLNFLINYTLVHAKPVCLGYIGAPIATSLSYWIMLLLLILYTCKLEGLEAWGGWSKDALKNWGPFLRLAIPGALMLCSEWWAYQITALATAYLGRINLATQSILLTIIGTSFQIPFAISIAAANRVGNSLGECFALKAKRASLVPMVFAACFGLLNCLFFMINRSFIGYLFTREEEVIENFYHAMPSCAFFVIADSLNAIVAGVIRGLGHQRIAAWISIGANYLLALPLAYILTFHLGYKLSGLWGGMAVALYVSSIGQSAYVFFVNWDSEVKRIRYSMKAEEIRILEPDHEEQDIIAPFMLTPTTSRTSGMI